jgi:FemAB-related protein (PEP-CTERM system-associated)
LENIRKQTQSQTVELRMLKDAEFDLPQRSNKVTFILDLPEDAEALMKSFKAKLRSQIRRPLKEDMFAKVGAEDLLTDFYYVFTRNMRDLGTPVYHKNFFGTILGELAGQAKIVMVYTAERQPVAAAFIIGFKDTMEIPWASSLRQYNRFSPNMLLYWEVLSEAIRSGYKKFDFGRGTKDGGTHRFKKQWGGEEVELHWYYLLASGEQLPEVNKENPKYAMAIKVWQKLPLFVTKFAGPSIVKHLP